MHRQNTSWPTTLAIALLLACGGFTAVQYTQADSADGAARPQGECERPRARSFAANDTILLGGRTAYPCNISIVATSALLRAEDAPSVNGIEPSIIRTSDGLFFSSSGDGRIIEWNRDGRFMASVGRVGAGPTDLEKGSIALHLDPAGRLFARDNSRRWLVFSPAHKLIGVASAAGMGYRQSQSAFLDNGTFLTSEAFDGDGARQYMFHVFSFFSVSARVAKSVDTLASAPVLVRGFGEVSGTAQSGLLITYAGGSTFWSSSRASDSGYEIQLWGLDGQLRRTIKRSAEWHPIRKKTDPQPVSSPPPTRVVLLHDDGEGVVFVGVLVNTRWRPSVNPTLQQQQEMADVYLDAIDARAGVLLASVGPVPYPQAMAQFPTGFFTRSRQGFKVASVGRSTEVRIVDTKLVRGH